MDPSTAATCAQSLDVETCAKAYVTEQATAACTAGVAAYTAGAGAAAGSVACSYLVPLVVDQVWKVVWPLVDGVWSGAVEVVEGVVGGLGGAVSDFLSGGKPFDRYHAVADTWGPATAALLELSAAGELGLAEVAGQLELPASLGGLSSASGTARLLKAQGPVASGQVWNVSRVWADVLRGSLAWSGGFELSGQSSGVPGFGGQGLHAVQFWDRARTLKGWTPGGWGVVSPTAFGPADVGAFLELARAGWMVRASAIPDALLIGGTAMVLRRLELESAGSRARAARVGLVLGVAGLATVAGSVYRVTKGRWPWSGALR